VILPPVQECGYPKADRPFPPLLKVLDWKPFLNLFTSLKPALPSPVENTVSFLISKFRRRHIKFIRRGITQKKLHNTVSSMPTLVFRSPNKFSRGAYGIYPIQAVNSSQKLTILSPLLYLVRAYTSRTTTSHEDPP
jgi:hypothetical protein